MTIVDAAGANGTYWLEIDAFEDRLVGPILTPLHPCSRLIHAIPHTQLRRGSQVCGQICDIGRPGLIVPRVTVSGAVGGETEA